jgi:ABC-type antimicrobial peptide transport system ATPase subunit
MVVLDEPLASFHPKLGAKEGSPSQRQRLCGLRAERFQPYLCCAKNSLSCLYCAIAIQPVDQIVILHCTQGAMWIDAVIQLLVSVFAEPLVVT